MKYFILIFTLFLTACDDSPSEEFYLSYKTSESKASFFDESLNSVELKNKATEVIKWCDSDRKRYFKNEICRDARKVLKKIN